MCRQSVGEKLGEGPAVAEFDAMHQRPQGIVEHAEACNPSDRPDPFAMAMRTGIGWADQRIAAAIACCNAGETIEIGEATGAKGRGIAGSAAKIADGGIAEVGQALQDEGERHHDGPIIADEAQATKSETKPAKILTARSGGIGGSLVIAI